MHKELIGQEAALSLPGSVDVTGLLLIFIEELMQIDGGESRDRDRLERDLRRAVRNARSDDGASHDNVVARFDIHDRGIDVRLTCENQESADVDGTAQKVAVVQA